MGPIGERRRYPVRVVGEFARLKKVKLKAHARRGNLLEASIKL